MDIVVNEELKAYIDPLTPEEDEALERSLLAEGCRDALVLWGNVLVDGHNRYRLCTKHGLPFQTVQNPRFQSLEDVHLWMIDQHLGRRSISDFQRGVLALRKREIVAERRARSAAAEAAAVEAVEAVAVPEVLESREALAKAARVSSNQMVLIEKIQKQAAPELVAAVKAGTVSINAAAAVATLPVQEQAAAAAAGAEELKQAAKRVREAKRRASVRVEEPETAEATAPADSLADAPAAAATDAPNAPNASNASNAESAPDTLDALRQRVAVLEAENAALRAQLAALQAG
jgi:hypothetical protein